MLTGCALMFAPKRYPLAVNSNPNLAELWVNGFKMGTTPIELHLAADKTYTIEF